MYSIYYVHSHIFFKSLVRRIHIVMSLLCLGLGRGANCFCPSCLLRPSQNSYILNGSYKETFSKDEDFGGIHFCVCHK